MNWNNFQVPGSGGMPDYGNFTQGGNSASNSYSSLTGWGNNLFDFSGVGGSSQYGASNNLFDVNTMGGGGGNGFNSLFDVNSLGGAGSFMNSYAQVDTSGFSGGLGQSTYDPSYSSLFAGAEQVGVSSYQSLNAQYGVGGLLASLGVSGASNTAPPSLGNYVAPPPTGGSPPSGSHPSGSPPAGGPPAGSPPAGGPPSGSPPSTAGSPPADSSSAGFSSASGNKVTLFGGSQSGENNINFTNKTDKDMYVYGQEGSNSALFKIPPRGVVTVSAPDNNGMRFQDFKEPLTPDQEAQLNQKGVIEGVTAPAQTGTLYETNYVSDKHLSFDDLSPLDGANVPMSMEGNGGRTVHFTQADMDGAPAASHNADGSVKGLGPSVSPTDNNAADPALRDWYQSQSLKSDGTRDYYFNSSDSGEADKANVGYTGAVGKIRTTVEIG